MKLKTFAVLAALAFPLAAVAQNPPPSGQEKESNNDAGKTYLPGIEQFMNVIQSEHIKLWFAARAGNWPLAAYQLGEIKEIMGDIQDLYPKFKDLPLADIFDGVITGPIADAEKAIDAKDAKKFNAAYDKLVTACNSCHEATGNGFVVIQRPTGNPFANQKFEPRKP